MPPSLTQVYGARQSFHGTPVTGSTPSRQSVLHVRVARSQYPRAGAVGGCCGHSASSMQKPLARQRFAVKVPPEFSGAQTRFVPPKGFEAESAQSIVEVHGGRQRPAP